jgi:basic membrane protein A
MSLPRLSVILCALGALTLCSCQKGKTQGSAAPQQPAPPSADARVKIGIVTDVGGRGDQSFNDSALRGLETWAAGKQFSGGGYADLSPADYAKSVPPELAALKVDVKPLPVTPMVLQSKSQEDYEPNLQLLVDQGAKLAIGTGFMLERGVNAVARRNPEAHFLLIDSPLLDQGGHPTTLPNVRTVVFKEEEGSFLAGALAGLVTQTGKVAFVGGMQIALIQKFEAGFRAGLAATNPKAAQEVFVTYTGSFDNVAAGKQVGQDVVAKGADVVFHAAGSDGLGVIKAVAEARAEGKRVYAIGVDSDQAHLAPDTVLTSMVKHVDLAVYQAARDVAAGKLASGDVALGLKEGGVVLADVRLDFPGKAEALAKVDALKAKIVSGQLHVPATPAELAAFKGVP